jgi:DNA mismatch endonuclease (patch repair protein)
MELCVRMKKKAGHRSWGSRGGKVPGVHRSDFMTAATRSKVMSRIRGKHTGPEQKMEHEFSKLGIVFERHCKDLPGCPDFVCRPRKIVIFVDGDFWHGYRFPLWEHKLSPKWREKIEATRQRDRRNFARLRRAGWKVLRIWEHQVEKDPSICAARVMAAVERAK